MKSVLIQTALVAGLATMVIGAPARDASKVAAAAFPSDDQTILHVLSRIGFGPRPGDIETVRSLGLQKYIDQQLHPERGSNSKMAAHLIGMPTLGMSSRDIAEQYAMPVLQARRDQKQAKAATDGAEQPKGPDPLQ